MTIQFENEYSGELRIPCEEIAEAVINAALDHEGCPYECEVSLLLVGDEEIQEMNEEFRSIDRSTDVLSFPMIEYEAPADFDGFDDHPELFDPESGELLLGDIVVSMDHVRDQAEAYGHGETREFAFLVAHSMLHLMGYDHMEDAERLVMEQKQEDILKDLGYTR